MNSLEDQLEQKASEIKAEFTATMAEIFAEA
jgi:hypothetical protein